MLQKNIYSTIIITVNDCMIWWSHLEDTLLFCDSNSAIWANTFCQALGTAHICSPQPIDKKNVCNNLVFVTFEILTMLYVSLLSTFVITSYLLRLKYLQCFMSVWLSTFVIISHLLRLKYLQCFMSALLSTFIMTPYLLRLKYLQCFMSVLLSTFVITS